jgi:hypothetical protein
VGDGLAAECGQAQGGAVAPPASDALGEVVVAGQFGEHAPRGAGVDAQRLGELVGGVRAEGEELEGAHGARGVVGALARPVGMSGHGRRLRS